ncbi:MAG: hypothetical protein LBS77_05800 [Desulfovibrio sp.]|nr:hypothetical protein [Desulfovibrio sp.]
MAPGYERVDVWTAEKPDAWGDNIASLRFDHVLGEGGDFEKMSDSLEQFQIQLGGDLPPAATCFGPDFMLQARHASRFDSIYAMVSVPRKYWKILPTSRSEWDCKPLTPAVTAHLADEELFPAYLTRDFLPWATPGDWAATGEVYGADGKMRR